MSLVLVVHLTSQLLANSAIIPIGPQSEVLEPYQALQTQNPSWLTAEDVFKKLVGHPDPAQPSAQSLRALVNKAREKEAHFKSAQAAKLRKQVFESIARAPVLSRELVDLASETGHDQVAALLAQGQQAEAQKRATWLMAHYNSQPIDKLRHPPNVVKILSQAGQPKAQTKLTITTSRGGTLFADGQELGQIESTKTVSLPNGQWKIWLAGPKGGTRAYPVQLNGGSRTLTLHPEIDDSLDISQSLHFTCKAPCPNIARQTAALLGLKTLMTLHKLGPSIAPVYALTAHHAGQEPNKTRYIDAQGLPTAPPPAMISIKSEAQASSSAQTDDFDMLWLLPFGGGQWVQDRPVAAMSYLAIQAGLAGWNIWASQRYKDSLAIDVENLPISEQIAHTDKLHQERGQAMTSLISFWSAVGIGIAEALIIGLIEEPQSPNSQD